MRYNTDMKTKITFFVAAVMAISVLTLGFCSCAPADKPYSPPLLGVWWWDNRLGEEYLDFAAENGVTEIYCYYSSFSQKTTDFISAANARDIDVLWLAGKYEWVEDYPSLKSKMQEYIDFQNSSAYKFAGVHLDVEPHQHPQFDEMREELITKYVGMTFSLRSDFPDVRIEYDIPFWLDDEITVNGTTKPSHEFVIDNADRVTVMSYRDSADKILSCAEDELAYAKATGKPLNLSVETGENEDLVTFYEEGNAYLLSQLAVVRASLPDDFGIAIHHIKDWKALADK